MQIHFSASKSIPPHLSMCHTPHCLSLCLSLFLCFLSDVCLAVSFFPFSSLIFIFLIPFSFLPGLDPRCPTIHLKQKKGLRVNSSPGDQSDWDWVVCAEIQDNFTTPGIRAEGLLLRQRERSDHSKKQRLSRPVFFSISVLPSLRSSVLIILLEPTAQAEGRETWRNRGGSVTSEGKRRVALAAEAMSTPLPSREWRVCFKGNTGRCFSGPLKWQSKSQKLIFFPSPQ